MNDFKEMKIQSIKFTQNEDGTCGIIAVLDSREFQGFTLNIPKFKTKDLSLKILEETRPLTFGDSDETITRSCRLNINADCFTDQDFSFFTFNK